MPVQAALATVAVRHFVESEAWPMSVTFAPALRSGPLMTGVRVRRPMHHRVAGHGEPSATMLTTSSRNAKHGVKDKMPPGAPTLMSWFDNNSVIA